MIDLRQNKGFALVFSLIFLFLIVSFMAVYMMAVATGSSESNRTANLKKAYYVADAGLLDAYERITQAGTNFSIPNVGSFIPSATTDNGTYAIGSSTGNYTVTVAISSAPQTNYTITSVGTFGGMTKTLQLKMTWASVSRYAYWSNTEVNPQWGVLWWVGAPGLEMLTNGPVQTNGQLNIFGNPIFNGAVTEANLPLNNGVLGSTPTSNSPNYYYGAGTSGLESNASIIFPDGITNDAPPVVSPVQNMLGFINSVANDGAGMILTGNSQVIFNANGTINVTGNVVNSNCQTTATYNNTTMAPPANGVVYVQSTSTIANCHSAAQDGNVTVRGTESGQLTVAADQNINISGNVAYNNDPRIDPASTDMVALVANQNITVIQSQAVANDGGPALEMSAVLVAENGSFQVDNWWTYMGNSNTAVMDQFGSLINYVCGVTGEMDMSGNLLGGWNQIQSYDPRLASMSPPGFQPMVTSTGNAVYNKLSITEL
jgi:Tfp pilus assembly protein PilX